MMTQLNRITTNFYKDMTRHYIKYANEFFATQFFYYYLKRGVAQCKNFLIDYKLKSIAKSFHFTQCYNQKQLLTLLYIKNSYLNLIMICALCRHCDI